MFLLWLRQLPRYGARIPASVPPPSRGGPALRTLLFLPLVTLSYRILHGSIYSFPLLRYSCLFLTGILHALLCLKVYSWCICGERCTPCPPTPLPSCSPVCRVFNDGIVTGMRQCLVLWQLVMWSVFDVLFAHLYVFFGEMSFLDLLLVLWLGCLGFFDIELHLLFVYFKRPQFKLCCLVITKPPLKWVSSSPH